MSTTPLQKLRAERTNSKRAEDQAATGSKMLQDGTAVVRYGSLNPVFLSRGA